MRIRYIFIYVIVICDLYDNVSELPAPKQVLSEEQYNFVIYRVGGKCFHTKIFPYIFHIYP
jgi:hypothetical protein